MVDLGQERLMSCFSSEKNNKRGREGGIFFKTQKVTLDHEYNEWTETAQEYSWDILIASKLSVYKSFFISPEIEAGADEKQYIYFYWP